MKNMPQRDRGQGAPAPYTKYDKTPYKYPGWVLEKREPPDQIRKELTTAGGGDSDYPWMHNAWIPDEE